MMHRTTLNISIKVSIFQLEKIYGKSSEAKKFIQEVIKGALYASLTVTMQLSTVPSSP